MRTRGSGLVTALTLALAALVVAAPAPAAAPAATGKVTADEPLPGSVDVVFGDGMDAAVSSNGRLLLASTNAGLSRMTLTRDHVVRTGTNARAVLGDVIVHTDGKVAYVVREAPARQRLQVFDIRSRTPRLLRALTLPDLRRIQGAALTPDGRRLLLSGTATLQVLRLGDPARPTKGPTISQPGLGDLTITPDGTRLVTVHSVRDEPETVRVWDVTRRGRLPLVTEREVLLPDRTQGYSLGGILAGPDSRSLYVTASMFPLGCEEGDCGIETEVVRLRLSDLAQIGRLPRSADGKETFPAAVSNNGRRVYARSAFTDDQDSPPGSIVWLDRALTTRNPVIGVGDVVELDLSPGGATRGLLYATTLGDNGRLKVRSVDPG
jgi:hypothetical protein